MKKKPPKVEDFLQIRLFVYFGTKSSTFGVFFLKILHFWLRKKVYFEENPPLLVVFFHFEKNLGLQRDKKRLKILVIVEVQEVTAKSRQIWEFGRDRK